MQLLCSNAKTKQYQPPDPANTCSSTGDMVGSSSNGKLTNGDEEGVPKAELELLREVTKSFTYYYSNSKADRRQH